MCFGDSPAAAQGPIAVPGNYQVRLTVGNHVETQTFALRIDPRLNGITEKDLQAQFDLAMKIRDEVAEANDTVTHIRAIRTDLADAEKKANSEALKTAADDLLKKLTTIEEDLYQVRNRSGQDPLNFPIKLNNQLAMLLHLVDMGDARPTDQHYAVFKELSANLEEIISRLSQILATDLRQFNTQLETRHLTPVQSPEQ